MSWLEIRIETAPESIEQVAAALTAGGFADLVIEDQTQFEEFLEDNRAYWDYIDEQLQEKLQGLSEIKLYLEDTDTAGMAKLQQLVENLKDRFGQLPMQINAMEEQNWEESWKDNYPPQQIGKNLVVLPYWLAADYAGERTPIILDPGLTFGTGAHPSTQMVLSAMERLVQKDSLCLDLGSGSGILSIAALRLGAKMAIGVDIDPKAEDIARENAAYNGFAAPEFTALTGNVTEDTKKLMSLHNGHYDFVFINIVADVIVSLAPFVPQFLGEKSTLICSGILDSRLGDVVAALESAGLTITEIHAQEDWRCVCAKRSIV